MLHLPKSIKIMLSYLLPGNNTPCTYSQGNLFLLIGITLAGKGKEKNPGKEIDHMKCCFLGSESSIV